MRREFNADPRRAVRVGGAGPRRARYSILATRLRTEWRALVALAGVLAVASCRQRIPNLDSPGTSMVCFGDSIAAGVGASPGQGFCDVLAEHLGLPLATEAVPGDTAGQGLGRLDQVFARQPWLVIVELGGNDILQQVPLETTEADLRTILDRLLAGRVVPVLVAVEGPFGGAHGAMYRRLADHYRIPLVDDAL